MKVYELITPETWGKGGYAQNKIGYPTGAESDDAVKWCAVGWLRKVYGYGSRDYINSINKVSQCLPMGVGIARYNDDFSTTFEDIKELFVKADL